MTIGVTRSESDGSEVQHQDDQPWQHIVTQIWNRLFNHHVRGPGTCHGRIKLYTQSEQGFADLREPAVAKHVEQGVLQAVDNGQLKCSFQHLEFFLTF